MAGPSSWSHMLLGYAFPGLPLPCVCSILSKSDFVLLWLTTSLSQIVLENGSVKAAGSPADLRSQDVFADDELADDAEDDAHHATGSHKPDVNGNVEVSVEQQISDNPAIDEAKKLQDAAKRDSKRLVKEETSASFVVALVWLFPHPSRFLLMTTHPSLLVAAFREQSTRSTSQPWVASSSGSRSLQSS